MAEPATDDFVDSVVKNFQSRDNSSIVKGLDQDKNKAATSIKLGNETGQSPERILNEYDKIYKKSKGEAAQQIVGSEPVLGQYVRENPLASSVSQDDWGALSEYTKAVRDFSKYNPEPVTRTLGYILPDFVDTIKGGIQGIGETLSRFELEPGKDLKQVQEAAEASKDIKGPKIPGWTPELQKKMEEHVAKSYPHPEIGNIALHALTLRPDVAAGIAAFRTGVARPLEEFFGIPMDLSEGLAIIALGPVGIRHIAKEQIAKGEKEAKEKPIRQLRQVLDKASRTFENAETWAKAGVTPPIGVNPVLDQLIGLESLNRMTALDAVMEKAAKAETKELSPEAWADLNKLAFKGGDRYIYLRWDRAKALYGDKMPEPGDGILGDVPGIAEQFRRSGEVTGEAIRIPMEMVPGLEKELYKQIGEDLFFDGGMSRREATELVKAEPEISTIHEQEMPGLSQDLRREFTLKVGEEGLHHVIDEHGQKTGEIRVTEQDGGKNLFISWEQGQYDTAGLITLMNHLKARYPNAETISTVRIPGVAALERSLQGSDIAVDMPFRIKDRPVDLVRKSSGLTPLFDEDIREGPRAVSIIKGPAPGMFMQYGKEPYTILDEMGRPVGSVEVTVMKHGKEVYFGWIGDVTEAELSKHPTKGPEDLGGRLINQLGPTMIRSILRQVLANYPEATHFAGTRVTGARRKAAEGRAAEQEGWGSASTFGGERVRIPIKTLLDEAENWGPGWHPLDKPMGPETKKFLQLISEGYQQYGHSMVKPIENISLDEMKLSFAIEDFLEKVIGKGRAKIIAAERIVVEPGTARERIVGGQFQFAKDVRPFIMWSLDAPDPYRTAGHEAIHFLRHYQFIRPNEWEILKKAAEEGNWAKTLGDRYKRLKETDPDLYMEETIAEEFKKWATMDLENRQLHGMAKVFQRIMDFIDHIKGSWRDLTGREPTANEIFRDIQLGRYAKREPLGVSEARMKQFGLAEELPEKPPPVEEPGVPTFAPGAIMDKKKYAQYQRAINEQNADDIRIERDKALREIKRRTAPEWRAKREEMRADVARDIGARPDFRARAFFQNGTFFGQDTHYLPKVSPRTLTKEQRAQFPARWQERGGLDPDDLAQPFGYQTGAQLIDALIQFEKDKGKLTPKDFFEKTVEKETDRRMELKYGNRAKQDLEEAQEQAVGHTQMDLLMQEAMALGIKAGQKLSLTKEDVRAQAHTAFLDSPVTEASYKRFFQEMYRTGKAAEERFLVGDYIGAFQNKWMQVHLFEQARQVKLLMKQQAATERVAKRFYKRYPDNFPAEFTEFIQKLLMNAGYKVDRHPDDLQKMFDVREHKGDLRQFADDLNAVRAGEEKFEAALDPYLIIPDFILDNWPNWKKNVDDMTVGEFKAFHDALQSLQKIGADQGKLHRLGEEADLQKQLAVGIGQLKDIGAELPPPVPGKKGNLVQMYHIGTIRPEDLLIRMDKGDELGFFTQFITDPLNDRAYYFDQNHKKFRQARIDADKKFGVTTRRLVENTVFNDPRYLVKSVLTGKMEPDPRGWSLLTLTHEHVRGVLLNWGNASNRERLIEGYHTTEADVYKWLAKVATKEDWQWAEAVGKMYAELGEMGHEVTMRESNTMVEMLPLPQISTPHGMMDGWYYPIHYDKAMDGGPKNTQMLSPAKNTRTYRGWERKRTGPAGPLELHLNSLDMDMNRRIHDLAYREVLRDFRKILNDPGMRNAISKRMGRPYFDMLKQLHDDIAQPFNSDSGALAAANKYSEFFRQNTIMMLVGLKIGTLMKHVPSTFVQSWGRLGLTKMAFWSSAVDLFMKDDKTMNGNWDFVMNGGKVGSLDFTGSREIARRWKHFAAAHGVSDLKLTAFNIREKVMDWSSRPIAAGDMLSSTILWNAIYKQTRQKLMEQGMSIEEAHTQADTRADFAVRQTHGSTSVVSRPEFMRRTNASARWFTSLYSYYNHVYGQFYRMAWRTKDAVHERQRGDPATQSIPQYASEMANLTMTYVALPAAFYWLAQEFLLGKEDDEEDHSLAYKIAEPVIHNVGGAFLGVRDIIGLATGGGQQPAPGIVGVPLQKAWEIGQDVKRWVDPDKGWKEEDPGKFIKHVHSLVGVASGLSSEQVGMWNQFLYNYMQAIQEPEGPADIYRGLRRGTIERRKR